MRYVEIDGKKINVACPEGCPFNYWNYRHCHYPNVRPRWCDEAEFPEHCPLKEVKE